MKTVDFDFGENRKFDSVIDLAKGFSFLIAVRLLFPELIAWKSYKLHTGGEVLIVKALQIGKLGSICTFAGRIDNDNGFSFKFI